MIWRLSRAASESIHYKARVYEPRGAERIRTAVRGFAGLCLTSRPPRQRACHRSGRKVALGRKWFPCAEWTHAALCEPCPGVDGAWCGWSPGPLPGLRYRYEGIRITPCPERTGVPRGGGQSPACDARPGGPRRVRPQALRSGHGARDRDGVRGRTRDGSRDSCPLDERDGRNLPSWRHLFPTRL